MNVDEILLSAAIGGVVGFAASYLQDFLNSRAAKRNGETYWKAMRQVIENTAADGLDIKDIFGKRLAEQNDYFKLWYTRANDIWRMIPYMASNNPSEITTMMETHLFITSHLALLPPSDCNMTSLGTDVENKYKRHLSAIKEFAKTNDPKHLKDNP